MSDRTSHNSPEFFLNKTVFMRLTQSETEFLVQDSNSRHTNQNLRISRVARRDRM